MRHMNAMASAGVSPSLPIQTVETLFITPHSLGSRANASFSREPSLLVPVAAVSCFTELLELPWVGGCASWRALPTLSGLAEAGRTLKTVPWTTHGERCVCLSHCSPCRWHPLDLCRAPFV